MAFQLFQAEIGCIDFAVSKYYYHNAQTRNMERITCNNYRQILTEKCENRTFWSEIARQRARALRSGHAQATILFLVEEHVKALLNASDQPTMLHRYQGHLKFLKIKGGSELYVQNFLNFAKSCVSLCLLKFDNIQ